MQCLFENKAMQRRCVDSVFSEIFSSSIGIYSPYRPGHVTTGRNPLALNIEDYATER